MQFNSFYIIRKFEGSFWIDVLEFVDARQLGSSDAVEVVREKVLSGGLPFFGGSVFCLVQKLYNGRERRIGRDVVVDRSGNVSCLEPLPYDH